MSDLSTSLAEAPIRAEETETRKIYLVGNPNVGKSVLFNALTGSYAVVSNYPGTTVEVSRSYVDLGGERVEVIDTPGMYSLRPITDEERVSRDILLSGSGTIVHVVDAKNLPRMLPLTLELAMMGRPLVLALNLMDEAEHAGVFIDAPGLSVALGIPVVELVATKGEGLPELRSRLSVTPPPPLPPHVPFPASVEVALEFLAEIAPANARRFWALHLLEGENTHGRPDVHHVGVPLGRIATSLTYTRSPEIVINTQVQRLVSLNIRGGNPDLGRGGSQRGPACCR